MNERKTQLLKAAVFLRGYFFDKDLPDDVRDNLNLLCTEGYRVDEMTYDTKNHTPRGHIGIDDAGNLSLSVPNELVTYRDFTVAANTTATLGPVDAGEKNHVVIVVGDQTLTRRNMQDFRNGNPENVWEKWQDEKLMELKLADTPPRDIAPLLNKTVTQVNNRWYKIKPRDFEPTGDKHSYKYHPPREKKAAAPMVLPVPVDERGRKVEVRASYLNKPGGAFDTPVPKMELQDSDWKHIKHLLDVKRQSVTQISETYNTEFGVMRAFIDKHRARDEYLPGEA